MQCGTSKLAAQQQQRQQNSTTCAQSGPPAVTHQDPQLRRLLLLQRCQLQARASRHQSCQAGPAGQRTDPSEQAQPQAAGALAVVAAGVAGAPSQVPGCTVCQCWLPLQAALRCARLQRRPRCCSCEAAPQQEKPLLAVTWAAGCASARGRWLPPPAAPPAAAAPARVRPAAHLGAATAPAPRAPRHRSWPGLAPQPVAQTPAATGAGRQEAVVQLALQIWRWGGPPPLLSLLLLGARWGHLASSTRHGRGLAAEASLAGQRAGEGACTWRRTGRCRAASPCSQPGQAGRRQAGDSEQDCSGAAPARRRSAAQQGNGGWCCLAAAAAEAAPADGASQHCAPAG